MINNELYIQFIFIKTNYLLVPNSVSKIPESSEKESQYKSIYDIKDKTDALLEKSNSQERSDYSNKSKKTDASSFDSNSDELIRKKKKSLVLNYTTK